MSVFLKQSFQMFRFPQNTFSFLSSFLFITQLSFSLSSRSDSNPILAYDRQVREGHLYSENHRRGLYLQITHDGRVSGSDAQTPNSVLELKPVQMGHIVIKGRSSSLFLCMDGGGSLSGQRVYTEADCTFRELLPADGYSRFLSSHGFPLSLASKDGRHSVPFTRFLLREDTLGRESVSEPPNTEKNINLDSFDLFGLLQNRLASHDFSRGK